MAQLKKWTAREIAGQLFYHTFHGKNLVVVPNCFFAGHEADLLLVRPNLMMIDIEIKTSRADLRNDFGKEKWLKPWDYKANNWINRPTPEMRERRDHPPNIWKHYYCIPKELWGAELKAGMPEKSGVLLFTDGHLNPRITIERQAKPNKDAQPCKPEDIQEIARALSYRMWKAYAEVDVERRFKETELAKRANGTWKPAPAYEPS